MLSPGERYKSVPRTFQENLRFRKWLLDRCRSSRRVRQGVLDACRHDFLFWVNAFVFQFNPKSIGEGSREVGPFVTWEFQDRAAFTVLDCIDVGRDLVVEKSRDMGASWLCLLVQDWMGLFRPMKKFLMISRNEAAVDKPGDPDSLFWKLDYVNERLPEWMAGGIRRRKMGFTFPTGSVITGQATTAKAGVGGRATAMFCDEFPQIDEAYEVLHRTSDTTACRIFNGTHLGPGTAFHELTKRPDMRKLVMHWTHHPDKCRGLYRYDDDTKQVVVLDKSYHFPPDFEFVMSPTPAGGPFPGLRSPWYDEQCARKGSTRAVAMDLDIDVSGSTSLFFDPVFLRRIIGESCCDPYWRGDVSYDRDTGLPLALVPSEAGPLKLWLHLRTDGTPPPAPYAFGADISQGTGATNSCLSGTDCRTGEKVLEYTNANVDPKTFGRVSAALCWLFKGPDGEPAKLCWEQQGPGVVYGGQVLELGFRNIYYRTDEPPHSMARKVSERPGWVPTPETKLVLLEDYRSALATRSMTNRSREALEECLKFKYTARGEVEHAESDSRNDPTGARVNHGDHVIADSLSWKMVKAAGLGSWAPAREPELPPVNSLAYRRERDHNARRLAEAD